MTRRPSRRDEANHSEDSEEREFFQDHTVEVSNQVESAIDELYRPDSDWVEWPFPDLTALVGRNKPGDVVFINGFSGNGKTLFVTSSIKGWTAQGIKTYVLPLETRAHAFRKYMACQEIGLNPGILDSGRFLDMEPAIRSQWEKRLEAELRRQVLDDAVRGTLKIKGVSEINLARLYMAAEEAAGWEAKILVVDHIDHIAGGDGTNLHAESVRVNKAAKNIAEDYGLVVVFTSQMNNGSLAGRRDRLAQFGPPMPQDVFMGGHKRFVATTMIGLHRRLRDRGPYESQKDYLTALKRSRDGLAPAMDALAPRIMAVSVMKSRTSGENETLRAFLGVEHGVCVPLSPRDHLSASDL